MRSKHRLASAVLGIGFLVSGGYCTVQSIGDLIDPHATVQNGHLMPSPEQPERDRKAMGYALPAMCSLIAGYAILKDEIENS